MTLTCRHCHQPIAFAVTKSGRKIPIEPVLYPFRADGGRARFIDDQGNTRIGSVCAPEDAELWLHLQHFSKCKRNCDFLNTHTPP